MRKVVFSFLAGIGAVSGISDERLEFLLEQTPGLHHEVFLETLDKSQNKLTSSGRRRTAQDKDCDELVDLIDTIEDSCSRFRYSVFQNLYPQLMSNAVSDSDMLGRTSSINDSFTGGLVSVMTAAIRETFNNQRDALYGPNGTCLSPKKGGLTATLDSLAGTLFSIVRRQNGAYDTSWRNSQNIDKFMSTSFTNGSARFANITGSVMSTMNQFQARLFTHQDRATTEFVNELNGDYLTNVSKSINMMAQLVDEASTHLDANYTDFHKIVDPMVNKILDQLDKVSDQFIHADDDFAGVIQAVGDKMNPVLTAVPGREASDPINSLRSSNIKSIKDFESASNGFVNSSSSDWANSFKIQMQSAGLGQMQRQTSIDNTANQIDSMFSDASEGFDGNYTVAVANMRKKIDDVRAMAKDLRATVWAMSSKLHNVKGNLQTMFDSLAGIGGVAAEDLRKRLAELMSSTGEASSDQLKSLLNDFSNLQNQLGGSGNAQSLKLMAALGNVREMVGRGDTSTAGASVSMQDSLSAQAQYSNKQASSVGSTQSSLVSDAAKNLMRNTDGTAANLYSTSTDMQSQQSGATRDIRSAVSGQGDVVSSGMAANELKASQTKLGIVSVLSADASRIDSVSGSAGRTLGQTQGAVSASLSSITAVNQLAAKASSDTANAATSLGSQLGTAADALADEYAKNSHSAYAGVTGKADSSQTAAASALGQQASGLSDDLKTAVADGDQKAGAAKSSIMQGVTAAEDSASDLGVLSDSVDGLIGSSDSKSSSTISDANSTLSGSLLGALASVQTLGSRVAASNSDSESQTSVEASKAVSAALSGFQGKASTIVSQSSVYSDRVAKAGPKLAGTDSALAQGMDLIKSNIKLALATVNEIASTIPEGGGSATDEALMDLKRTVHDASSLLATNVSSLAAAAARVAMNVSSGVGLPDGFQTSLSAIVEETLANSDKINQLGRDSYEKMIGMSAGASNDSVAVLSDLESIGKTWQDGYSVAIKQGAAQSRQRVGEFGGLADDSSGIANLMSSVQANRAIISQSSRSLSDMTDSQLQQTVGQLVGSVQATKGSLSRASSSAGAQASFNSQVDNGSAGKFLQALQQEAQLSDAATASSASAMKDSTGRASMDIQDMESKLAADQQARQERMAQALSAVSGIDSDFTKNISGNKDAIAIQLLMARRAVRNILNSWTGYSDYETKKFEKMASTDEEYIQMSQRNLDNSESESHAKLIDSKARMDTLNSNLGDVLTDYMSFSNSTSGHLGLLSELVPLLNRSATGSITQLSESAFSFDKSDVELDVAARNETLTALADFEASLDRHANMAISAANGNLLPALSAGA